MNLPFSWNLIKDEGLFEINDDFKMLHRLEYLHLNLSYLFYMLLRLVLTHWL